MITNRRLAAMLAAWIDGAMSCRTLALLLLCVCALRTPAADGPKIDVFFSSRMVDVRRQSSVLSIQPSVAFSFRWYSFTSAPIAKALVEAKRRGVTVRVILDSSQRTAKSPRQRPFSAMRGFLR